MTDCTIEQKEKLAQFIWTGFILMFFLIQAVIWTVAISITSRDSSHSVVADYDQQALMWDETQAAKRASESLQWNADLQINEPADILGNRNVAMTLIDASQQPIENASVSLRAYHRGRSAEVQELLLDEISPGIYESTVQVQHGGSWQFSGLAVRGQQQFLIDERQLIAIERNR